MDATDSAVVRGMLAWTSARVELLQHQQHGWDGREVGRSHVVVETKTSQLNEGEKPALPFSVKVAVTAHAFHPVLQTAVNTKCITSCPFS